MCEGILYTSTTENLQRKEYLRETFININNCLSPIGMGLNLFLRSSIECQSNISVLETQFCNTTYSTQTIPLDCFVSLITLTIFNQIILPMKFEYTLIVSLIGSIFLIVSMYKSYLHHQLNYSPQTIAMNCILGISYVVMIIFQVWIHKSKVQQFVLQDGMDTMAALHRRRREVALAVNSEYPCIAVDDQTVNTDLFFHNFLPTNGTFAVISDNRDNNSMISEITLE